MSERLRYTAASQVFEAFPHLWEEIETHPVAEAPLDFARKLLTDGRRFDAVVYCAHMLARRESVWWGCQCVRAIAAGMTDNALLAAEAWVRDPEEESRRAALEIGNAGNLRVATTWLARAAGHAGGSLSPEGAFPIAAPPQMTASEVKAAIILAIAKAEPLSQPAWKRACVEAAIRFAGGGDSKVMPPAALPAPKPAAR